MKKKFLNICENVIGRYTRGGFLVGDYVRVADGFEKHEPFKLLGSNVRDMIAQMIETGLQMRLVGINDTAPSRYPGNPESMNGEVSITIALDNGGGRYTHYCNVPSCCINTVDHYPNLAPFPQSVIRPNGTIIKPQPVEMNTDNKLAADQTLMSDQGGKKKRVEISLPTKNVKIPSVTVKGAPNPSVDSYTINYIKDM